MAIGGLGAVVRQMNRLLGTGTVAGMSEGELLERFLATKDEAAFEALVKRFGPMVLGVCRQSLQDPHAIDDAFQATFLVLVRRARTIRNPDLLGNWLYGVAVKVAKRARANDLKRRCREQEGMDTAAEFSHEPAGWTDPELGPILHEELARLPEKYRVPIVLCYLDGRTNEEAAGLLNWPVGTVKGRVSRAKDLLRDRLARRGVSASVAVVAATLAKTAEASLPPLLLDHTVKAAMGVAAGSAVAAGLASAGAYALSESMVTTMAMTKIKIAAAGIMSLGLLATGATVYAQLGAGEQAPVQAEAKTVPKVTEPLTVPLEVVAQEPPSFDLTTLLKAEPEVGELASPEDLAKRRIQAAKQRLDAVAAFYENGTVTIDRLLDAATRYMDARIEDTVDPAERTKAMEENVRISRMILKREEEKYKVGVGALPNVAEAASNLAEVEIKLSNLRTGKGNAIVAAKPDPEATIVEEDAVEKAQNEKILAFLNRPISFPFTEPTPLEDVVKYVKNASTNEGFEPGIPIYIDPTGLTESGSTPNSPITIALEGVKAKTCLRLALKQLDLVYYVREGLLTITSSNSEEFKDLTQPGWRAKQAAAEEKMQAQGGGGGFR